MYAYVGNQGIYNHGVKVVYPYVNVVFIKIKDKTDVYTRVNISFRHLHNYLRRTAICFGLNDPQIR